jgi:hypothetical protein
VLLSDVPSTGGWASVLAGTSYEDVPLQNVTLAEVLAYLDRTAAPTSLTLASLDLASTPISSIPISSIALAGTPISSIPISSIGGADWCDLDAVAAALAPDCETATTSTSLLELTLAGVPISSIPISSIPISSIDLAATPISSIPISSIPISSIPISSIPISSIEVAGTPISSIPISSIDLAAAPISSIPISSIDLVGSTIGSLPISSIPISSIPISSIPISSIPISSIPLGATPISSIPISSIASLVDCDHPDLDCDDPATTLADVPVEAWRGTLGDLPADAWGDTVLADLPAGLWLGTLGDLLAVLPCDAGDDPCSDPLLDVLQGLLDQLRLSDLIDGRTITVQDLLAALDRLTLADLVAGSARPTLGDVFLALLAPAHYPWEDLGLTLTQLDALPTPPTGAFVARATVAVGDLPPRARPQLTIERAGAVAGELRLSGGVRAELVAVEPVEGGTRATYALLGAPRDGTVEVEVPLRPAVLGPAGTSVRTAASLEVVDEDGTPLTATDDAGGRTTSVTPAFPGSGTPDAPTALLDDTALTTGHLLEPGQRHLFALDLAGGERLSLGLTGSGTDVDLVLYAPTPTELAERSSLTSTTTGEEPIDLVNPTVTGVPPSLDDVPLLPGRDVVSASARRGTDSERIATGPLPAGRYLVQVTAAPGEVSGAAPYLLRTGIGAAPSLPPCEPWAFDHAPGPRGQAPAPSALPAGTDTLVLLNQQRVRAAFGPDALADVLDAVAALGAAGLGVTPAVVAVDDVAADAYAAWDTTAGRCSPASANGVVAAIGGYVDQVLARDDLDLQHVVLVGGDDQIPMARLPDRARLSNQYGYAARFPGAANELVAAFAGGYLLSDDPYGDRAPLTTEAGPVFASTLSVGRLVEDADDIVAALRDFVTWEGRLDPATASSPLVSGYDFLDDGAEAVATGLEAAGRGTVDRLISPPAAAQPWTAVELLDALRGGDQTPRPVPSIASVNAHYDHQRILPADQDRVRPPTTFVELDDLDLDGHTGGGFARRLLFSMGCHGGLSVSDVSIGAALGADWAQLLASQGASYVGNTGYGYGDTEIVDYSERLLAGFAHRLDGSVPIGRALADAKQAYLATAPSISPYDAKVLSVATLYGLPMYAVGTPGPDPATDGPAGETSGGTTVGTGGVGGAAVPPGLTARPVAIDPDHVATTGTRGTFHRADAVRTSPWQPHQPLAVVDVTEPGRVARGALITSMRTVERLAGFDPVVQRPTVDLSANEPEPELTGLAFPDRLHAIGHQRSPTGLRQNLLVTTGRFTGASDEGVQRLFGELRATVYHAAEDDPDLVAPRIGRVEVDDTGDVEAEVLDDGEVARVVVLYAPRAVGVWELLELTPAGDDRWTGDLSGTGLTEVELYVQALDGGGNVSARFVDGITLELLPDLAVGVDAEVVAVGGTVTVTVTGAPAGRDVVVDLGDGTVRAVTSYGGPTVLTHVYTTPGIYTVTVTVGATVATFEHVVVHATDDASVVVGGQATGAGAGGGGPGAGGGGPGAGGATVSVNARSRPGRGPATGEVTRQLQLRWQDRTVPGWFVFTADTLDWLVVEDGRATLAGIGTVDGVGGYRFRLVVVDGAPDRARLQVTIGAGSAPAVVYDNGDGPLAGTPPPMLAGQVRVR